MKSLYQVVTETEMQRVFVVLKPGSLELGDKVIDIFKENGWSVYQSTIKRLLLKEAMKLYYVHKNEEFYESLCKYMSSAPCRAFIFEKPGKQSQTSFDEVAKIKDEIRQEYGESEMRNVLHSSDSEVFKKSQYFYGMQFLDKTKDYIILTEGVFDVILPQMYGASNVICALGTTLSEYQINVLAKLDKEVIVVYDNDDKGLKTMKKVMPLLESNGISAKLLVLPTGKDLAEITLEVKYGILDYILDNSVTYGYYQIQNSVNSFNRDLYSLYHKYSNIFDTIKDSVPESEKVVIQTFIDNCFKKGVPLLNVM